MKKKIKFMMDYSRLLEKKSRRMLLWWKATMIRNKRFILDLVNAL